MIRIGKYTISEHDKLNLKVTALERRTIESQMIADKMTKGHITPGPGGGNRGWRVGDEYEHEEFIGYFPKSKPELAFERVFGLLVSEGIAANDDLIESDALIAIIKNSREQVIEAVKGVEA